MSRLTPLVAILVAMACSAPEAEAQRLLRRIFRPRIAPQALPTQPNFRPMGNRQLEVRTPFSQPSNRTLTDPSSDKTASSSEKESLDTAEGDQEKTREKVADPGESSRRSDENPALGGGRMGVRIWHSDRHGVVIVSVDPKGPAARAGIVAGDRILNINGRSVSSTDSVIQTVSSYRPGRSIALQIQRGAKPVTKKVVLAGAQSTVAAQRRDEGQGRNLEGTVQNGRRSEKNTTATKPSIAVSEKRSLADSRVEQEETIKPVSHEQSSAVGDPMKSRGAVLTAKESGKNRSGALEDDPLALDDDEPIDRGIFD